MKVKISKACESGGKKYRSGDSPDLDPAVAQKLIDRGFAKEAKGKEEPSED